MRPDTFTDYKASRELDENSGSKVDEKLMKNYVSKVGKKYSIAELVWVAKQQKKW